MAINVARYQVPPAPGVQIGTDGNDTFNGSPNFDFVQLDAGYRDSVVTNGANGPSSVTSAAGIDTLNNITQLLFVDGRLVYNDNDHAAQVSRLYDIVLDRGAEQTGLNSFINQMDGGVSMAAVAETMFDSAEFTGKFGANLTNEQFVQVLYNNMRGADASAAEVSFWTSQVANGSMTLGDVAVNFANSAEGLNANADTLSQGIWDRDESAISLANLYDTAFDRLPELDGMAHWVSQIHNSGTSMNDIADLFYSSGEAQAAFGGLNDFDFVNAVYQNALNRNADDAGASYWTSELASGDLSRADVMLSISDSTEHQAITADAFQSDNPLNYGVTLIG